MQAYHNDENLKSSVLAEMKSHREADNLIKGSYWEGGKGCAVGCLIKGSDHSQYEPMFGIPTALAQLEDQIFEGLSNGKSQEWPERFLSSFDVGKDYSKVWNHFAVWLLIDPDMGQIRYADEQGKVVIQAVAKLHQAEIDGNPETDAAWSAARSAARSDAWSAAESAAWSAAYEAMADKLIELIKAV